MYKAYPPEDETEFVIASSIYYPVPRKDNVLIATWKKIVIWFRKTFKTRQEHKTDLQKIMLENLYRDQ